MLQKVKGAVTKSLTMHRPKVSKLSVYQLCTGLLWLMHGCLDCTCVKRQSYQKLLSISITIPEDVAVKSDLDPCRYDHKMQVDGQTAFSFI